MQSDSTLGPEVLDQIMALYGLKNLLELSTKSGVRHSIIYNFRAGRQDIGVDTRRKLAHAFPDAAHLLVADIMPAVQSV